MNSTIDHRDLRLRFVTPEAVLLHEETDPARVSRLRSSLEGELVLRNPPIAAAMPDGRYVVLDGATRTTALRELQVRHIPVQVVPYLEPETRLEAWYHVLPDAAADQARAYVEHHASIVTRVDVETAREALNARQATAALVESDGQALLLTLHTDHAWIKSSAEPESAAGILRGLVGTYGGAGEIYRIVHTDLVDIVQREDHCPCVVMFPTFTPDEIMGVASHQDLLPAGITRHLISGRVLNMNMDLDVLRRDQPLNEKNQWMRDWLTAKILAKKVRYYHEPVFIFDD
ncbi:MAG: hypothetical protein EHM43_02240 [Ignavibacteriae bacterium]|nr:MAG: hypothetical protein EHM43_02240 [Ignavibacteriota bacterium]